MQKLDEVKQGRWSAAKLKQTNRGLMMKKTYGAVGMAMILFLFGLLSAPATMAFTIEPVSVRESGGLVVSHGKNHLPNSYSTSISHDGSVMTFMSNSSSLALQKDGIMHNNVILRNIKNKTTSWIDISKEYADILYWDVFDAQVSGDGKFIVLSASVKKINNIASNNSVYIYDVKQQTTTLLKENLRYNSAVDINYDGRFSVFYGDYELFIYDRILNAYEKLSYPYGSARDSIRNLTINIDDEGTYIIFNGNNLVNDVFIYNRVNSELKNIVNKQAGDKLNGRSYGGGISANGKYALLLSQSLVSLYSNVYVYDMINDTLSYANFADNSGLMYAFTFFYGTYRIHISNDGRYVAAGLVSGINRSQPIGVLDRHTGLTRYFETPPPWLTIWGTVGGMTPDGRYLSVWYPAMVTFNSAGILAGRFDMQEVQPYSADAGPDQTIEQTTPYGAYATLRGALSAGTCTDEQIYRWSWPGGETIGTNPTIFLPPGTTDVTLDWAGCGETASDTVNVTVVDSTPPILTVTGINGTAGNAGWYRSDVSVQFAADDSGSGVAAIYSYTAAGEETIVAGALASIPINGDGGHTLTSWAVDNDENRSNPPIVTAIQIDSIAPAMTGAALTQPNANGWYNTDMTVHFSATDTRSGIASVTPDTTLSTEGAGQSVIGTAFDVAGNSADYSVNGINLDRTPPLITITGVASGDTYNLGLVPQATFSASDSLSGLAGSTGVITGTPDAFGCGTFTYTVTATDKAGNTATPSVTYAVKATPAGTSALIDALVNMGLMPSKTAEALKDTLARALSAYNSNPNLGDNMMNTFLNQTNAALNSGKISSATAALLNNAANYIMVNN